MGYGVERVVGGFGRSVPPGELIPATIARTYTEHYQLRGFLSETVSVCKRALDVGCGYGRMTPVLGEYASEIYGVERDEELCAVAARTWPPYSFRRVENLWSLPFNDGHFDLVLTFTVLQHMNDEDAARVLAEISRVGSCKSNFTAILCEDTNAEEWQERKDDFHSVFSRPVEWYQKNFPGVVMVGQEPRYMENANPQSTGGTYMAFTRPDAEADKCDY